ncbi:heparanase-like isoform X1 [Haliotis cracherodii]|uniref:heparanase-like isoform X1 n=1 Tax=Haliotis cracherodii TaxID=6455 RepID=UPI0039E8B53A
MSGLPVVLLVLYWYTVTPSTVVDVNLMTDAVIQEINQTVFVGVALDVSLLQNNWEGLNFSNDKVLTLASGLSPCYLRFGGYAADALTFNSSLSMVRSHMTEGGHLDPPVNFTMTGNDWDILNEFSRRAGMNLIFGLNALKRDGLKWDPTNALELLRYTQQKGYKLAGIELGNEPDEFLGRYEVYVDPDQMGTDALTFQKLLRNMSYYNNTLFIGPDTAKPFIYLDEYLDTDGGMAVDAVSFHQYYFSPEVADLVMFTEPYYFDQCIKKVIDAVDMATFHVKTKPVWLGETSTVKGAGSPGLSNTYVAALMWLDKLGVAAKFGIKTVIRQDLYGSYNSLIQPNTFDPNPDYWVTLLYKRLVGSRVFNLTTSADNSVRVYAHCAKQTSYYDYGSGSVVLYAVNLNRNNVTFSLLQFGDRHLDVFWLTSQGNNITATVVQLNGSPLHLINNAFPALNPLKLTSYLTIPALSLGFVVIPDAKVKLCI